MKNLLIIGILGIVFIGCDYSNRSNGNIDAAFRAPSDSINNIDEIKENKDPANWIYNKEKVTNNEDSINGAGVQSRETTSGDTVKQPH